MSDIFTVITNVVLCLLYNGSKQFLTLTTHRNNNAPAKLFKIIQ